MDLRAPFRSSGLLKLMIVGLFLPAAGFFFLSSPVLMLECVICEKTSTARATFRIPARWFDQKLPARQEMLEKYLWTPALNSGARTRIFSA
jgi:hypothetical protein